MNSVEEVADILRKARQGGRLVFLCGNGGSAALAAHFACDLMKVGVRAFDLGSNNAVVTAFANDYGYEHVFSFQLGILAQPGDVLLTISTSGKSHNILNAIDRARQKGIIDINLVGKDEVGTRDNEDLFSEYIHKVIEYFWKDNT